jgi:hypothetical protein
LSAAITPEHRERHDQDEREAAQDQRVLEPVEHEGRTSTCWIGELAPVAADEVPGPREVALHERIVGAELWIELVDLLLARVRAEDRPADVARQHLGGREDGERREDERDRREPEPSQDIAAHLVSLPAGKRAGASARSAGPRCCSML